MNKKLKYDNQWRKDNPNRARTITLRYRYGITYEDWLKIWINQDGRCAICGEPFAQPSNACIDHNHKTGEIRGLLCKKCNLGIGCFDDNQSLMGRAIKYVSVTVSTL